jgi:Sec7-like guanine-nucleotide exchange factor
MKKYFTLLLILLNIGSSAQSFNEDKTSFVNFVKRMYTSSPFEGVKIVEGYEKDVMISVVAIEATKYPSESIRNRVAQVKAQEKASTFVNGAQISLDVIISTKETTDGNNQVTKVTESMERIRQSSTGFSQGLELLVTFEINDKSKVVYIFGREM